MRTEDLKDIPELVSFDDIVSMLERIGFGRESVNQIHRLEMLPCEVKVEVAATDEKGRYFGNDRDEAAHHHISIPIVHRPRYDQRRTTIVTDEAKTAEVI